MPLYIWADFDVGVGHKTDYLQNKVIAFFVGSLLVETPRREQVITYKLQRTCFFVGIFFKELEHSKQNITYKIKSYCIFVGNFTEVTFEANIKLPTKH